MATELSIMNSPEQELLSLNYLDKVFGHNIVALENMTLSVRENDFLSLLGPSGCGKSTALRIISGLMSPTRGKVKWADSDYSNQLSVVFQEPTLMPWATIEDNVWLPMRLKGIKKDKVIDDIHETLALVGLKGFEKSYPRELSGGMKMRVSIARAMVTKPKLILMDEPFAALDEITRFKLNNDLLAMKERIGCTVIFVTHSVFESVFLSNRIVVMASRPGRVLKELNIEDPGKRDDNYRASVEYSNYCSEASEALKLAMGDVPH